MAIPNAARRALVLASAIGSMSSVSRAADPAALVLSYEADPSCPDAAVFTSLVREKISLADAGDPGVRRTEAMVSLRAAGPTFLGQLRIRWSEGWTYSREVGAGSCDELAAALAFVLALALEDPRAVEKTPAPTPAPPPAPIAEAPLQPQSRWTWSAAVQLGARTGLSPTWMFAETASIELRQRTTRFFAPTLRLGLVHAEPVLRLDRAGQTRFTWLAARGEVCPVRLQALTSVELIPCVVVHGGRIGAAGDPSTEQGRGNDAGGLWVDGGVALRLEWQIVLPLSLQVQGEAIAPVTRHRFAFDNPDTLVYEVPVGALAGFAGIGLHLP